MAYAVFMLWFGQNNNPDVPEGVNCYLMRKARNKSTVSYLQRYSLGAEPLVMLAEGFWELSPPNRSKFKA